MRKIITLVCLCLLPNLFGQIQNAECNTRTPWLSSDFNNLEAKVYNDTWALWCPLGIRLNDAKVLIDGDLNNPNIINFFGGVFCDYQVGVRDRVNTYPAGTYAGFNIGTGGLLPGVNIGTQVYVTTYLNGVEQESKNIGLELLNLEWGFGIGDRYDAGFVTKKPFNDVRVYYSAFASVNNEFKIYYPIIQKFCEGPELVCNTSTALINPEHPVFVDDSKVTGLSVGSFISDVENVINDDISDAATIFMPVGVLAEGYISVKNSLETYPAGYFAGFEFSNGSLIGLEMFSNITITTYLDNVRQESKFADLLLISAPLIDIDGRATTGFITSKPFNEVRFTVGQPIGVDLGATLVYNAVIKKYCEVPELECNNSITRLVEPTYPVNVNSQNTGIIGLACVGCSIQNTDNIIDESETNYADIIMLAAVGTQASVAVRDGISTYPAGTYAGFDVQNLSLINADVLNAITVNTYLNGTLQESRSNSFDIATVGTSIVTDDGRRIIGFISEEPFDEVQIQFTNLATVDFGTIRVYSAVIKKFCEVELKCNQTNYLSEPEFPVVVESTRTGFGGLACVFCSVNGTPNVISQSNSDYATITTAAGVLTGGSVSVKNGVSQYPAGSTAGFVIQDANTYLQADLIQLITISTYLDGRLQERETGVNLLDFAPIVDWIIGSGGRVYNAGFRTTKPYDEIQVGVGSLASVANVVRVYTAFVDTRGAEGCSLYLTDDTAETEENSPVDIDVLQNDFNLPSQGTFTVTQPNNGTVVINDGGTPSDPSDNTLTYTPNSGFLGDDSFTYTVCDNESTCDSATVSVSVLERQAVPDYALSLFADKVSINPNDPELTFRAFIKEILNENSVPGTPVVIEIIKSNDYEISFDPNLELLNGVLTVSNPSWEFDDSDPTFYRITYTDNGGVYTGGLSQFIAINLKALSFGQLGDYNLRVAIKINSGGEENSLNNRAYLNYELTK